MTIEYKVDDWLANLPALKEVITYHYDELTASKAYPLDPVWENYENLWNSKGLHFITCKDDGVLVGYIIFFYWATFALQNLFNRF